MGKKKLDELIQEKFQGFSEIPDERVWQRLENSLDKKNSRRVIPLWWKLAGVAAGLLIAFWAINPFSDTVEQQPTITDTEEPHQNNSDKDDEKKTIPFEKGIEGKEDAIVGTEKDDAIQTTEEGSERSYSTTEAKESDQGSTPRTQQNQRAIPNLDKKNSQITANEQERRNKVEKPLGTGSEQSRKTLANTDDKGIGKKVLDPTEQTQAVVAQNTAAQEKGERTTNQKSERNNTVGKVPEEGVAKTDETTEEKLKDPEKPKKSIFDEIEKQQEEEEAVAKATNSRWSAGPSIAPIFYSSFGEGSPVHSDFIANSKSGETNLSYGLSVAYEINNRLSVRSGVHRVDFGYGTDDVEFRSSAQASGRGQIDNIDYSLNSRNLIVQSKAAPTSAGLNEGAFDQSIDVVSAANPSRDGTMSQEFGYLEVPLELNYALVDKKFGVNLIGGFSSLFLVDNSISVSSTATNERLIMGEANNVNKVNFSTNVGLGLNYNFTPKVRLNIEPVFKYQLNTFSTVDGTFQPFSVGLYSGLSFRF